MRPIRYVNFTPKGLQPIADELTKKHKQPVLDIKANNLAKREDGFAIKTAIITLESGQKLQIKIKANGSIYQVRLNNKVIPVKNAEDVDEPRNLAKAIDEMADYIKRNEATYLKQRRRRATRKEAGGGVSPGATTSTAKRLVETKTLFEDLKTINAEAQKDLTEAKGVLDGRKTELEKLTAELAQEQERNESLRAELAELREAA